MSAQLIQDQSSNETPAQTSPHPYVIMEEEVTEVAEGEQAVDPNGQLQLPNYIMQSIVFSEYEGIDPFPSPALNDMNGTPRERQQVHNGTIRPDQTYIVSPPEYTPEVHPPLTTVESAPHERSLISTSRQARALENSEQSSVELNSLDRSSTQLVTTASAQGLDGQSFQRPRLSFHHTPIPQLEWPGRRTQQVHREEQGQRERRERQQLQERQQSIGQASSAVLPSQAQEPETSTDDDDDDDELDPPFPRLSRQPRQQIRFINRENPSGPVIPADSRLNMIPQTANRRGRNFQIQYEEHPPTESFTPRRRQLHLTVMATPAGTYRERSNMLTTSLRRRSIDHRFRHFLSHYHSHAAPPTPPSSRIHHPSSFIQQAFPPPSRLHPRTDAHTRTGPPPPAGGPRLSPSPRPLTRSILEAHARNPRVNPYALPWNAAPFVIACQRLRIRAAATNSVLHSRTQAHSALQVLRAAALQRAIHEATRVNAAITQLALCGALTDSAEVLAGVESRESREREGRGSRGSRGSRESRVSRESRESRVFERRGGVPTGRIVTPAERRGMREVLARRERAGEREGLLAELEGCFGRVVGGWLFDVWVVQGMVAWLAVESGFGDGDRDRYGRRERVGLGLGLVRAPIWGGEDGGDDDDDGGERHGSGSGGGSWDSMYMTDDSDAGLDSDLDSDHGHVHERHQEEVRFPSMATAVVGGGGDEDNGFRGFHLVPDGDDDEEGVGEGSVEWREGGPGALNGRFVVRDVLW